MKEKHIKEEMEASKQTIKDLKKILDNATKGLEVNEFVLGKLEEEWKRMSQ